MTVILTFEYIFLYMLSHSFDYVGNLCRVLARHWLCRPIAAASCLTVWIFKIFESIQSSSVGDSGYSVMPTFSGSPSGKAKCKGVELNTDIRLSISFDCRHFWLNLPVTTLLVQVPKHPCCSSAVDVLFANTAKHNELPRKPNLFLPATFADQPTQIFRHSSGNTNYFWPGLKPASWLPVKAAGSDTGLIEFLPLYTKGSIGENFLPDIHNETMS